MSTRTLMAVAGIWTLIVWGTRIPLLETDATGSDWFRIGLGVVAAVVVIGGAVRYAATAPRMRAWVNVAFAFAMVFLWLPSLLSVWTNDHELGFRLVHTALAGISMGFGVALAQRAQDTFRPTEGSHQDIDDVGREEGGEVDGRHSKDHHRS